MFLIDSIGLDLNRPWPFIFIGWGGLIPQEIMFTDLNLLRTLITVGFLLDRSGSCRIRYNTRPVRPLGQTGQTGWCQFWLSTLLLPRESSFYPTARERPTSVVWNLQSKNQASILEVWMYSQWFNIEYICKNLLTGNQMEFTGVLHFCRFCMADFLTSYMNNILNLVLTHPMNRVGHNCWHILIIVSDIA